ncbi:hypothetical protein CTAYLR_009842 [Chrysophaeum taylorii]|uniref:U2A'/phosphoprotein 32 family A C-terminal domain-containing protein n=1 Tax=Chrysophaeum taylorii TaxID=2483200 RepID=A0AAD7XF34_9STRA|nr:hypothetical protein CTAYLR_009842 [Chrysophaeum taylorii]
MAPLGGQREHGAVSLIRASIRAATTTQQRGPGAPLSQQGTALPHRRHSSSRVAALPTSEPRIELKAQSMPLYAEPAPQVTKPPKKAPPPPTKPVVASKLIPGPSRRDPVVRPTGLSRVPRDEPSVPKSSVLRASQPRRESATPKQQQQQQPRPSTANASLGSDRKRDEPPPDEPRGCPNTPRQKRLPSPTEPDVSVDRGTSRAGQLTPRQAPTSSSGGPRRQQQVSSASTNPPAAREQSVVAVASSAAAEKSKEQATTGKEHADIAVSSDGVYFAQYKGQPDALVVYRSAEERCANPERLNLDRRHLTVCPILKSEERVRLLNYQNNYIEEIRHLSHLPNLIFLDLYNNCIERLSKDMEHVPTLRVLMLGKNRIKQIAHLEKLSKLDVLDLHSNAISKIEQLESLTELRVLNLAGNKLTVLEELSSLQSLTELNVRRNQIEKAHDLDALSALQRVFLSNNRISTFSDVACLFRVRYLMELSMDGNPVASDDPRAYRRQVVERIPTLKHLDLKRITDSERRAVALEAHKEDERKREVERREMEESERRKAEEQRQQAIEAAEREWLAHSMKAAAAAAAAASSSSSKNDDDDDDVSASSSKQASRAKQRAAPTRSESPGDASLSKLNQQQQQRSSSTWRCVDKAAAFDGRASADAGTIRALPSSPRPSSSRQPKKEALATTLPNSTQRPTSHDGALADLLLGLPASPRPPADDENQRPPTSGRRRRSRSNSGSKPSERPSTAGPGDLVVEASEPSHNDDDKAKAAAATTTTKKSKARRASPGYYEVDTTKDLERCLQIYGEAWECLENAKIVGAATALVCRFVSIDRAVERLRPHAKLFAKLRSAVFSDNAIHTLRQVAALASVLALVPTLVDLRIESNPVCSLVLLRPFVACVSANNLETFNAQPIPDSERLEARGHLGPLCAALSLADNKLSARHNNNNNNNNNKDEDRRGTRSLARKVVDRAVALALAHDAKRRAFRQAWPEAIASLVDECLDSATIVQRFFEHEPVW